MVGRARALGATFSGGWRVIARSLGISLAHAGTFFRVRYRLFYGVGNRFLQATRTPWPYPRHGTKQPRPGDRAAGA